MTERIDTSQSERDDELTVVAAPAGARSSPLFRQVGSPAPMSHIFLGIFSATMAAMNMKRPQAKNTARISKKLSSTE